MDYYNQVFFNSELKKKESSETSAKTPIASEKFKLKRKKIIPPNEYLACIFCHLYITAPVYNYQLMGKHTHLVSDENHPGLALSLFREAPGCLVTGELDLKDSWFKGFGKRESFCHRCRQHLGWYFSTEKEQFFFGLILDNLIPNDNLR